MTKIFKYERPEKGRRTVKITFTFNFGELDDYQDEETAIRLAASGQLKKVRPVKSKKLKSYSYIASYTASELKTLKLFLKLWDEAIEKFRELYPDKSGYCGVDKIIDQETGYDWRWYGRDKQSFEWPQRNTHSLEYKKWRKENKHLFKIQVVSG